MGWHANIADGMIYCRKVSLLLAKAASSLSLAFALIMPSKNAINKFICEISHIQLIHILFLGQERPINVQYLMAFDFSNPSSNVARIAMNASKRLFECNRYYLLLFTFSISPFSVSLRRESFVLCASQHGLFTIVLCLCVFCFYYLLHIIKIARY